MTDRDLVQKAITEHADAIQSYRRRLNDAEVHQVMTEIETCRADPAKTVVRGNIVAAVKSQTWNDFYFWLTVLTFSMIQDTSREELIEMLKKAKYLSHNVKLAGDNVHGVALKVVEGKVVCLAVCKEDKLEGTCIDLRPGKVGQLCSWDQGEKSEVVVKYKYPVVEYGPGLDVQVRCPGCGVVHQVGIRAVKWARQENNPGPVACPKCHETGDYVREDYGASKQAAG